MQQDKAEAVVSITIKKVCDEAVDLLKGQQPITEELLLEFEGVAGRVCGGIDEVALAALRAFLTTLLELEFNKSSADDYDERMARIYNLLGELSPILKNVTVKGQEFDLKSLGELLCDAGVAIREAKVLNAASDYDDKQLVSILVSAKKVARHKDSFKGCAKYLGCVCDFVGKTTNQLHDITLDKNRNSIKDAMKVLRPIAGGADDGEVWDEGAPKTMKALLEHAKLTLMRADGPAVKSAAAHLENELANLARTHDIFSSLQSADDTAMCSMAKDLLMRARATIAEAILVDNFSKNADNPLRMKTVSKTQLTRSKNVYDHLMNATLMAGARSSLNLQFSLE